MTGRNGYTRKNERDRVGPSRGWRVKFAGVSPSLKLCSPVQLFPKSTFSLHRFWCRIGSRLNLYFSIRISFFFFSKQNEMPNVFFSLNL